MNKNNTKHYSCIVLSGGGSRRMGKDKGSMIIQDKPMIFHILNKLNHKINDAVIVLNNSERVAMYEELLNQYSEDTIYNEFDYDISFTTDEIENKGPLCGIMTGLKNIKTDYAIVFPCDSPYIEETYIDNMFKLLKDNNYPDAIIPYNSNLNHEKDLLNQGQDDFKTDIKTNINDITDDEVKIKQSEPLHSIYSKKSLLLIEDLIKNDDLFVKSFMKKLSEPYFVLIDDDLIKEINFKNINRLEDIL